MSRAFLLLSLVPAAGWAGAVLVGRRRGVRRAGDRPWVWFALAAAGAHAAAQLAGATAWGHVHLAYLVLTVAVPLCAAAVLVAELGRRRPVRPAVVAAAAAGLLPAAIGFYATHVEPFRVSLETATLEVDGLTGDEVRVAVFADPQVDGIGGHEAGALGRLLRADPDLLLVPGDLFSAPFEVVRDDVPELRRLLRSFEAPVLVVTGDHDQLRTLEWLARGTDVVVLDGAVEVVVVGGARVAVAGVGHGTDPAEVASLLDELGATAAAVRLVLSHEPETARLVAARHSVDLVVAGDTHGGQVRLPIVGLPYNPSAVPDEVAAGGLHRLGGTDVYVSRGVGVLRGQAPQVRLGAPPAVDLITLR